MRDVMRRVALLVAWLTVGLVGVSLVERGAWLGFLIVVAGVVAQVGLWYPRRGAGVASAGAAALAYAGARVVVDRSLALDAVPALALLLGTGMLAEAAGARAAADAAHRRRDELLLEELSPSDPDGPAHRWAYAERELARELPRAKRYAYPITIALLLVAHWEAVVRERGAHEASHLRNELAALALRRLRASDRVASRQDGRLAVILPHTSTAGAAALLDGLRQASKREGSLDFHAGLAEFPGDGATVPELLRGAEMAVEFARASDIAVATSSFVREEQA